MADKVFENALRNFTMDAAAGDAIRHLADKGMTPVEVREHLTFPAPMDYITGVMWDHFVKTRRIITQYDPEDPMRAFAAPESHAYEIVEHYDEYGRKSFLNVQKESPEEMIFSPEDYIVCDYKRRIASGEKFTNDYIIHLPWPDRPVLGLRELFSP